MLANSIEGKNLTVNMGNEIIEIDENDYDDHYDNLVSEEAEIGVSPVQSKLRKDQLHGQLFEQ